MKNNEKYWRIMKRVIQLWQQMKTFERKWNQARVCEIKSVNRHSMISDGAVSSWNELAALVYITSI